MKEENKEVMKGDYLDAGLMIETKNDHPDYKHSELTNAALGRLESIVCGLTSTDKYLREYNKKRVRELVKLGKEAGHDEAAHT